MSKAASRGDRKPSNFRKTDVKRTAEALKSAGLTVTRVELQDGKVVFFPHGGDQREAVTTNEWDGAE